MGTNLSMSNIATGSYGGGTMSRDWLGLMLAAGKPIVELTAASIATTYDDPGCV